MIDKLYSDYWQARVTWWELSQAKGDPRYKNPTGVPTDMFKAHQAFIVKEPSAYTAMKQLEQKLILLY